MSCRLMFLGTTLCALVTVLPVRALAEEKVNITGKYTVEGTNPEGGTYEGSAEITKKGDTYEVAWVIAGNEEYRGVGILQGNTLSVAYANNAVSGVVVYRIEKGPKLVGEWAILGGNGKIQKETLTPK